MPPSRPLSRQRILRAAFQQADQQGLESVSMRTIASRLGVEAMSLYHHVPNKQAVLDGLFDLVVQAARLPTGELTIEEWVRGSAEGLRALARSHPRLVPVFSTRSVPLEDPRSAEPFEAGLAAFVRAGYSLTEGFAALQSVSVALLGMVQLEAVAALLADEPDPSHVEALSESRFPLLHQVAETNIGLDEFWQTLVDALVRGLQRRA